MRGLRVGTGAALAVAITAGMAMAASAPATGSELLASWQMEETSGSVMVDSSSNGFDGVIGQDVVLGEATPEGNKAYRFKGDWWVVNDQRLIQIPDDPRLDPAAEAFSSGG